MHDWEIFSALGERLAVRLNLEPMASVPPDRLVDAALRGGPYGDDTEWQLSIERLKAHPSGIDLGPLNPSCPGRLQTPDKRIRLAIPEVLKDIQRFRDDTDSTNDSYRLIGRRHVRDNNSCMHNQHRLMKGKSRCHLLMLPDDMAKEGWYTGMTVAIHGRVGSIEAELQGSDEMMPGVVSLPHGYGHARAGTLGVIARQHAGEQKTDDDRDNEHDHSGDGDALQALDLTANFVGDEF